MFVFAFDRDWTVDVNPHPKREAVPLEWVRYLAHESEHAVYAIGNQDLVDEADVPGIVDIVDQHPDNRSEWLGERQSDGRYERFPARRERLRLLADMHSNAERYIVVDDIDLSDVAGWDHYHAWEFVPAVRRGEVDPALPWVREPTTDGGLPTTAGIVPVDAAHLDEFLADYTDAPGFELTHSDEGSGDGDERTRLLWDISVVEPSGDRSGVDPVVACTPLTPGEKSFTCPVDTIEMLSVVRPPPDAYLTGVDAPADRAVGLRRLAAVDHATVSVSEILTVIESGDEEAKREAVKALGHVADDRPAACTPALPVLRSLLDGGVVRTATVLGTIRRIAAASPPDVAPMLNQVEPYLESDTPAVRCEATRCIAAVADSQPTDATGAVDSLARVVADRAPGYTYALHALACVSRETVEPIEAVSDTLGACLADDGLSDGAVLNAMAALGRLVGERPEEGVAVIEDVAGSLDADHHKRRANAAGIMSDTAKGNTMAVKPYLDGLVALLTDDDTHCRINASAAVSRVAADFPEPVRPHTDTLVGLLDDENEVVRGNACWALGHLGAEEARNQLERLAVSDGTEQVRDAAAQAVHEITETTRTLTTED